MIEWERYRHRVGHDAPATPYRIGPGAEAQLFVEDEIVLNEGIRSTVRLPLIVKGEVIGAFFLDDVVPGRYTESDLDLLVPLGEQLAVAIENARLHDELEQKVEERTSALQGQGGGPGCRDLGNGCHRER